MNELRSNASRRVLALAALVEIATGIVLIADPALVVKWLLGMAETAEGDAIGRVTGVALLALGLACWPRRTDEGGGASPFVGMVVYNLSIALYLAGLRTLSGTGGALLWPVVVLHVGFVLGLLWERRVASPPRRR